MAACQAAHAAECYGGTNVLEGNSMRSRLRSLPVVIAAAVVLAACGQGNQYVAPPLPKVTVAKPAKKPITRYLECHRQHGGGEFRRPRRPRRGLHRDHQLRGRRAGEEGRSAVHDRARALQGEARSGQGRRKLSAESSFNQAQAAFERSAETDQAEGHDPGVVRFGAGDPRRRAGDARQRARQYAARRDQLRICAGAGRRSTASCRRARSRSGPMSAAPATPTVLATIVQLDPIWVNFNISEQDVIRVRAALAERGATREDVMKYKVEVALQDETDYPHVGLIDYVAPTIEHDDRHAGRPRRPAESEAGAAARLFRAHPRSAAGRGGRAAGSRRGARQRSGRALRAGA